MRRLCFTRDACPVVQCTHPIINHIRERRTHLLPNTRSLPLDAAAAAAEAAAFWARNPAPAVRKLVVVDVGPDAAAVAAVVVGPPEDEEAPLPGAWAAGLSTTLHGCTNHRPRRTTSRDNKLRSIKLCSALKSRPRPSYDRPSSQDPWSAVPSAMDGRESVCVC